MSSSPWLLLSVLLFDCRPRLVFSPAQLPEAVVGEAYRASISVAENTTPVSHMAVDGTLPPGLSFAYEERHGPAELSGIPTAVGTYAFVISASCLGTNVRGQEGGHRYTLNIRAPRAR